MDDEDGDEVGRSAKVASNASRENWEILIPLESGSVGCLVLQGSF